MAISLTFDYDACMRALVQRLIQVMDSLMDEFYRDATKGFSPEAKKDSILLPAKQTDKTEHSDYTNAGEFISATCEFYTQAIIESFGVGTMADRGPQSYWTEYTQMRGFNKARTSGKIVGRTAGNYIDIWGNERRSDGRNAGKNLEGLHLRDYNTGEYHQVGPTNQEPWTIHPTHSIQNAEAWINKDGQTKVERRIKMEVEKFLSEEAGKFFVEVGV